MNVRLFDTDSFSAQLPHCMYIYQNAMDFQPLHELSTWYSIKGFSEIHSKHYILLLWALPSSIRTQRVNIWGQSKLYWNRDNAFILMPCDRNHCYISADQQLSPRSASCFNKWKETLSSFVQGAPKAVEQSTSLITCAPTPRLTSQ